MKLSRRGISRLAEVEEYLRGFPIHSERWIGVSYRDGVAQQHLALSNPGHVQGSAPYIIPQQYWQDVGLSESQPNGYLLFEGCTKGKGQLVVTLHKSDGTEIGE